MTKIQAILEEFASNRELNLKYGPAVMQAAVIMELRALREAIEKLQTSEPKKRGKNEKNSAASSTAANSSADASYPKGSE